MLRKTSLNRRGLSTMHIVLIVLGVVAVVLLVTCVGLAAIFLPALSKAREQATMIKSGTQVRQLEMARSIYAQQFRDPEQRPEQVTIQMLIDEQYITAEVVQSPFGPVSDGRGDFWLNPRLTIDEPPNATGDNRMIASYDRAMYESGGHTNLAYYSGEVLLVTNQEFERLIAQPANADVDFDLPVPQQ